MTQDLFSEIQSGTINVVRITQEQAEKIKYFEEGQFGDVKGILVSPAQLSKAISAFANSDGGDLFIGISATPVTPVKPSETVTQPDGGKVAPTPVPTAPSIDQKAIQDITAKYNEIKKQLDDLGNLLNKLK